MPSFYGGENWKKNPQIAEKNWKDAEKYALGGKQPHKIVYKFNLETHVLIVHA